ncbi:hypothetical protein EDC61_11493 [Sulfuritortus calidifontis]|uniref:DUF7210 domain-containing protein n=1 Tax=Sulfuritortus calidifontis TaxID=1914471 RepID=A0A4R3JVP9_9PROT|nr:hypothetical protein [Sulfuritortus calidifontis]TCS70766.1 hypothetical protein EDC61_11493 [Sulfuritortus calidifontis]
MNIELTQPHTHAGEIYPPGATLDLPDDAARWLIDKGVARAASGVAPNPVLDGMVDVPAVQPRKSDKPNRKE